MRGVAAIDVVADEVHSERVAELGHFDAVDTKAGVVLGFAGAITAPSGRPVGPFSAAGLFVAVLAGLLSLMSFWPRKYWRTDLNALRAKYLAADPAFARVSLARLADRDG